MPFTPSHVLAVLPGIGPRGSRRAALLLPSALVAGTVVPDITYYVPGVSIDHSLGMHTARGVVTTDLVVGLVLVALWLAVLRTPLLELAPDVVRSRVDPVPRPRTTRAWLALAAVAVVSVLLGAWSHVAWDELTHPGGLGAQHVPWIAQSHAGVAGSAWLQLVSSAVGLVGTAWWLEVRRRRTPPRVVRPPALPVRREVAWGVLAAACVVAVLGTAVVLGVGGARASGFVLLTGVMTAVAWTLVAACVAWWAWRATRGGAPRPGTRPDGHPQDAAL
ncbi:uncharacterized protein DUF4184 [Sediminihabitans luteus]|uniref:Uncharacterized protein DUF4184 n=1 Tax=Sediminihabitans luteus TaxID=1138585 RepID=A0A2M9D0K1_9CELL|nr:DUF4184 family protein [Sediminihabitans luteus]PJJ77667.1 uncharacterized protein DUF4184 [Sediminihabitans luteus]GII98567.1 hypothetical protein Slu03_09450 [Sediminihabitans luteus]